MALVQHPYILGAPHRLKYFRAIIEMIAAKQDVLFWTGSADRGLVHERIPSSAGCPAKAGIQFFRPWFWDPAFAALRADAAQLRAFTHSAMTCAGRWR